MTRRMAVLRTLHELVAPVRARVTIQSILHNSLLAFLLACVRRILRKYDGLLDRQETVTANLFELAEVTRKALAA